MSRRREQRLKSKKRRAKLLEGVEIKTGHVSPTTAKRQKRFYQNLIERRPDEDRDR